jgi:lipoprotein NlpD
MTRVARALLAATVVALAGCIARPRAVVVERSYAPPAPRSTPAAPRGNASASRSDYLVERGDTLYGIAFKRGVDFRDLARWNSIPAPYTIYPGQRLRIGDRVAAAPPRPSTPVSNNPPPRTVSTPPRATPSTPVFVPVEPRTPVAATPANAATSSASIPAAPVAPVTAPPTPPPSVATLPPGGVRTAEGLAWRWPASGQIVSRYVAGDPTRQGVNVAGSAGQPVYAAGSGEVVYSGSGLIGYGELIIIKHSDVYLSAYGHNRKRLVSEGQRVVAGQQVAEMGRSGAARDMLHFEIRKNGKPIDPLPMLPRR